VADKITNFEDYKKRGNSDDIDIEIVDPYNFFTEEEREEYFRERQKQEQLQQEKEKEESRPAKEEHEEPLPPQKHQQEDYPRDEDYDDGDEDYEEDDEDYDEEDEEGEEGEGKDLMLIVVRFASILTGIVILAALAFGAYKFIGPKLRPDPDEEPAEEVVVALPEGYQETNDMVTVTAVSLNLRTVPSSESDATIVTAVPKGTSLKRIAQSSTDTWAIVEYEGQQLYASSKYLAAP
jgi:uncharacterized protein YgiM (DUF1202 family)